MSINAHTADNDSATDSDAQTQGAYLAQTVSETLHYEELPDFDVWMEIASISQDTVDHIAEEGL